MYGISIVLRPLEMARGVQEPPKQPERRNRYGSTNFEFGEEGGPMAISQLPVSRPIQVPENSTYVVTIDVIVTAETQLAAADRVADLGRRLTEDCGILDWSFQSLEKRGGTPV